MSDTVHQIKKKVKAGLASAREKVKDDPALLAVIDLLEIQWEQEQTRFLELAWSVHSFHWRPAGEVGAMLNQIKKSLQTTVVPNTDQVGSA